MGYALVKPELAALFLGREELAPAIGGDRALHQHAGTGRHEAAAQAAALIVLRHHLVHRVFLLEGRLGIGVADRTGGNRSADKHAAP